MQCGQIADANRIAHREGLDVLSLIGIPIRKTKLSGGINSYPVPKLGRQSPHLYFQLMAGVNMCMGAYASWMDTLMPSL